MGMKFSATRYGSSFLVHNLSKTRIAISNPRNVAPFANGDLLTGKQGPAENSETLTGSMLGQVHV